jgi:hypothetical protein
MPPVDPMQTASHIPPLMPKPPGRYVQPSQLPSWNSGGSVGAVPVVGESGTLSPLLATAAGGAVGYMFGGWSGAVGASMVVLGANNLGLVGTDKPALRLAVAAIGIGLGGYVVSKASKGQKAIPNAPSWLKKVVE